MFKRRKIFFKNIDIDYFFCVLHQEIVDARPRRMTVVSMVPSTKP